MKKPIIVANWKSFKNPQEAQTWVANLGIIYRLKPFNFTNNIIIVLNLINKDCSLIKIQGLLH